MENTIVDIFLSYVGITYIIIELIDYILFSSINGGSMEEGYVGISFCEPSNSGMDFIFQKSS